jgi:hypothetical protein
MIVSTTLASVTLKPVFDVVDCDDVGGGGGTKSFVGISPATAVTDISPVRATAMTNRFIRVSFGLRMQANLYQKWGTLI